MPMLNMHPLPYAESPVCLSIPIMLETSNEEDPEWIKSFRKCLIGCGHERPGGIVTFSSPGLMLYGVVILTVCSRAAKSPIVGLLSLSAGIAADYFILRAIADYDQPTAGLILFSTAGALPVLLLTTYLGLVGFDSLCKMQKNRGSTTAPRNDFFSNNNRQSTEERNTDHLPPTNEEIKPI